MKVRERYLKTLAGEKTDRMPVSLFIVEQGHFMTQLHPETDPYDHEKQFRELIDFNRRLGADTFVRLLADLYEPALHVMYGGVDVGQQTDSWEVKTTEYTKGKSRVLASVIRTPEGTLTQEFTINEIMPGTFMYGCTAYPVKTERDLDLVIQYEPKMPETYPGIAKKATARVKGLLGDDGIVGAWVYGAFNNCSQLIRHEELYSLFLVEPEFYEKLIRFSVERFKPYTKAVIDAGADVVNLGGNVPGGFLGRRVYDEYILPYEKELVDFCQGAGVPCVYHNCGKIMDLVESYKDLGVSCVEPFSPHPLGDAELGRALELIDGAYTVIGGVDQVNIIKAGSREQVVEKTREAVLLGKEKGHGKFIIQNADFLEYGTPVENVEAFVKTALEYGAY